MFQWSLNVTLLLVDKAKLDPFDVKIRYFISCCFVSISISSVLSLLHIHIFLTIHLLTADALFCVFPLPSEHINVTLA